MSLYIRRSRGATTVIATLIVAACYVALSAIGQTILTVNTTGVLDFSADEKSQILAHGPWPLILRKDPSNRSETKASVSQWGASLFFDVRLSGNGKLSCASCHIPNLAFQDGNPTAIGQQLGIRNTPSLLDSAQARWLGWGGTHDSLWSASLAPLLNEGEMNHTLASFTQRMRNTPELASEYKTAYKQELPPDDATLAVDTAKALAAYQATLVSPRNAFDDFRDALARGDTAAAAKYPLAAQRGLRLFIGAGRCTICHAGPRFSNGEFADIGVSFFVLGGVDSGRYSGLQQLLSSDYNRLGRFNDARDSDSLAVITRHVILEPRNFGEFKVPGLRQLTQTSPYMHNGSLNSIEDVVQHYSQLNEERLHADGERILQPLRLTDRQADDLVAFLRSLSN